MNRSEAGKLGYAKTAEFMRANSVKRRELAKESYARLQKRCPGCQNPVPFEHRRRKFCGECAYSNRRVFTGNCENCGIPLTRGKKTRQTKFCSCRCQQGLYWKIRKEEIGSSGVIDAGPRVARRYLIETRGHRCEVCTGTKWLDKPIPLILDHINGNPEDNAISNLRLVCGNCDMQLPTYKSKNKGNGRAWRRQRYAEGKSY